MMHTEKVIGSLGFQMKRSEFWKSLT